MSLAFLVALVAIASAATTTIRNNVNTEVIEFLQKYGYLGNTKINLQTPIDNGKIKQAISLFQEYYRIQGNGTLNDRTLRQMRRPRCGFPDIPHHEQNSGTVKWGKTRITWNFHLADADTLKTAEYAFSLWEAHTPLTFERQTLNPDILIAYRGGVHAYVDKHEICPAMFDGISGVLAHAFFPSDDPDFNTEIHLDAAEPWYIHLDDNVPSNFEHLLQTLTHEIGHSLGLPHSSREDSIMFAFATNRTVRLTIEDILAIQYLYGGPETTPKPTPPPPPPPTTTRTTTTQAPTTTTIATITPKQIDLCDIPYVNNVLVLNHRIFVTYRNHMWMINMNDKIYDGPFALNTYMDFLPANFSLTAAYQRPSGEIVMFANNNTIYMIDYPSFTLKEGWPKRLSDLRLPANVKIHAVINTNRGRTYVIFDNDNVALIDECTMNVVEYLTLQSVFPGIPSAPSLAFRYTDGSLYFINKRQYYKYNEFTRTVTEAGKFAMRILNVECPKDGILQQLKDLLQRLFRSDNMLKRTELYQEE